MLVDVFPKGILGSEAEQALGQARHHGEQERDSVRYQPAAEPERYPLGTPAVTTRGMKEPEMRVIAKWIVEALEQRADAARLARIRGEVLEMAQRFPLYGWLRA